MARYPGTNYFVVRHDLASLKLFPGRIWNSTKSKPTSPPPIGFRQVEQGDQWIAFAYIKSDSDEKAVSEVTGIYECIGSKPSYSKLPQRVATEVEATKAWVIEGRTVAPELSGTVVVPPLRHFLGKHFFNRKTITRITPEQFREIVGYVKQHRFNPTSIPGLHRDPRNEQEVLTIIASDPARFGIEKIIKVQTRFPDMKVKLKGKADEVHLELELCSSSFSNHGHAKHLCHGRFVGTKKSKGDGNPVGVLCWLNDDENNAVGRHVNHRIFELRDLLKHPKARIRW